MAYRKVVMRFLNLPCCKIFYYSSVGKNQKISHRVLWQGKLRILMFNEEELKHYENILNRLGVKDGESQQRVLEFMYTLGTIIYNKSIEV